MKTYFKFPHEYRIPVTQESIRSFKGPEQIKDAKMDGISFIHAIVKIRDFPSGSIPDKINPRSHEVLRMKSKIPQAITETLNDDPENFHLLNRGCLIIAKNAWYNNKTRMLHFIIESEDEHGMVDGATTDRVLQAIKNEISEADFTSLSDEEIPDNFKNAYLHIEIISGDIDQDFRIKLADARNTSLQVKEFSLQDLGGGFDWLKDVINESEFRGKVRYRENEPKPVDIRTVLALLTLFHPRWLDMEKDPIVAYTGKGAVLGIYKDEKAIKGYKKLAPIVVDILKLYDYIHLNFKKAYKSVYSSDGKVPKFGLRKEVRYIKTKAKAKVLPLTGKKTQYVVPDGWLYPILGSLRMLVESSNNGRNQINWVHDPLEYFDAFGPELVNFLVDRSEELGRNPNAIGKSKGVWLGLRGIVENRLLKEKLHKLENK